MGKVMFCFLKEIFGDSEENKQFIQKRDGFSFCLKYPVGWNLKNWTNIKQWKVTIKMYAYYFAYTQSNGVFLFVSLFLKK